MVITMTDEERKRLCAEVDGFCAEVDEITAQARRINHEVIKQTHLAKFGHVQPQRTPESEAALRSNQPKAELDQHIRRVVDERIVQWLVQERAETDWCINKVFDDLDKAVASVVDDINQALNNVSDRITNASERTDANLANSNAARRAAVEAVNARYDALEARLKLVIASEGARVIDDTTPIPMSMRRNRNMN
jgi:hypothetical protein